MLLSLVLMPGTAAANEITIRDAQLEQTEEGPRLSASYDFELPRVLEDALLRGIPLYFTSQVQISRPRWYWFDERAIRTSRTKRISYNLLTREFRVVTLGSLQQSFSTLDEALSMIRTPGRWLLAGPDSLKSGESYRVSLHMELDVAQLPKPFQVHALNSSDWRLSSDWMSFTFKVEEK